VLQSRTGDESLLGEWASQKQSCPQITVEMLLLT